MVPGYIQEAFFGSSLVTVSKENPTSWLDQEEEDEDESVRSESATLQQKLNTSRGFPSHRIHLDENMLKSAQQDKKSHLELGIEGCIPNRHLFII